jgi:DNA polymerase III sliding clamp (beta) subunit (PCNA family)
MFSIGKDVFMKALTGIGKVLSVKGSLPVLGCVRITGAETGATVSATNLEEYIAFNFDSAKVSGDDDVIVELAALKKFLSGAAGGGDIVFERCNAETVKVTADIGGQRMERIFSSMAAADWPTFPETPKGFQPVTAEFFAVLHTAFPSASRDQSRKALTCAFARDNSIVATTGQELVVLPCELPANFESMIPPAKLMTEGFFSADAELAVKMSDGKIPVAERLHIKCGHWNYSLRLPDGNYPNYLHVIPPAEKLTNSLTFGTVGLDALRRALPCLEGDKGDPVTVLHAGKSGIHLFSQNMEVPYAIIADGEYQGGAEKFIPMGRNKLLRAFKLGYNKLSFADEFGPMMATGGEPGFMVFMPFRMKIPEEKLIEYLNNKTQNMEDRVMKTTKETTEVAATPVQPQTIAETKVPAVATAPQGNAEAATVPAEPKPGLMMIATDADPFDELLRSADELRLKVRDTFEAVTAFQKKIRDAQKAVKFREKNYRNTRELMEKFKMAGNF